MKCTGNVDETFVVHLGEIASEQAVLFVESFFRLLDVVSVAHENVATVEAQLHRKFNLNLNLHNLNLVYS